ncbi:hypothetical protein DLJ74_08075 [Gracilibacillus dipsosauri]|uniref:KTSC domain-containing protein n=2 Tax=Gracilibacillus dipsosauri TaxID=178340 RepID=A0A317KYA6_9BACI|nr:hypothetical protein DLJ74_08075 [Gracilibacillus dipsosauri]
MMKTTTFNRQLWELNSFDSISYDKEKKLLCIYFFNGITLEFHSISEEIIFQFILETNKEGFIEERLKTTFPFHEVTCPSSVHLNM